MGMAASQARLLQLTSRKNDIGRELQHLSNDKTDLTREMQAISREYQSALSSKVLKWSNNSGITVTDLNYATLMYPGTANGNKPVLISDSAGRIVLNDKYAEYAALISESGAPGGDYEGHRTEILASLAGISSNQISTSASTSADVEEKRKAMEEARDNRDKYQPTTYTQEKFISKFLSSSALGIDSEVTKSNASSNASKIKSALSGKNFFQSDKFQEISSKIDTLVSVFKDDTKYTADEFVQYCAPAISEALGGYLVYEDRNGNGTRSDFEAADQVYQDALKAYQAAAGVDNEVFTGTQEKEMAFYDRLFTAIAEQGWVNDSGIEDSDYMSQMLQNNSYYIITMEENTSDNATSEYLYDMDIASNFSNIFVVNDSDARDEALVEYEYKKSLINEKETRIDTRMKNLETEQSAIVKMIESIDKVKNDNIENTFSIFT